MVYSDGQGNPKLRRRHTHLTVAGYSGFMEPIDVVISAAVGKDQAVRRPALRELAGRGVAVAPSVVAAWRARSISEADRLVPVIVRWPPELVARLFAPFLRDDAPGIAVRAAAILGRVHDEVAISPLVDELAKPGRLAAAAALGQSGVERAIEPLQQLFSRIVGARSFAAVDENDPSDAELIAIVIKALGRLGEYGNAGWLIDILNTAEEVTARAAAALALREVPTRGALGALAGALSSPNGYVQESVLRALWSYRAIEAVDAVMNAPLSGDLLTNAAAMLYDVVALEVADEPADWTTIWASRRASLATGTCLLAGMPITPRALVERVRNATRIEQALRDLELFYGLRLHWDAELDDAASLLDELDRWSRELELRFAPGRLYRFGREVPTDRLPAKMDS